MENCNPILTILIPSRYRFDRLIACIDSYVELASDINTVEFIVKFDVDDLESVSRINEIRKDIKIKFLITERLNGYYSLHDYANYMYLLATGTWIMLCTDDAVIKTRHWDLELAKVKEDYVCLSPYENGKVSEVFPIVSLISCKLFDCFCLNHAQDRWFNDVYGVAGKMVELPQIEFYHYILNDQSNEDRRIQNIEDNWDDTAPMRKMMSDSLKWL